MAEKYEQQIDQKIIKSIDSKNDFGNIRVTSLPNEVYKESNPAHIAFITMVDKLEKHQCTPAQVAATLPKGILSKLMTILPYKITYERWYKNETEEEFKKWETSANNFIKKFKVFLKEHEKEKTMLNFKETRKLLSAMPLNLLDSVEKSNKETDNELKNGYQELVKSEIENIHTEDWIMNDILRKAQSLKDLKWKNYFDKSTANWKEYDHKETKKFKDEMTNKYLKDIDTPEFDWLGKLAEFKTNFEKQKWENRQQLINEIEAAAKKYETQMSTLERVDEFDEFDKLLRLKNNDNAVNYVKNSPQYKLLKQLLKDHAADPKYSKYKSSFSDIEHEYFGNEENPGKLAEAEYQFNLPIQFLLSQGGDIITGKTSIAAVLNDIPLPKELVGEKKLSKVIKEDKFSLQEITSKALDKLNDIQAKIYNDGLIKEYPANTPGTPNEFINNLERIEDLHKYAKVGNMPMIRKYIDDRLLSKGENTYFETLKRHFNANDLKNVPNVNELRAKFADVETGVAQFREKWLNKNTGILADDKNFSSPEALLYQIMQAMDEGYEQIGKPYISLINALLKSNYDSDKEIEITNNKGEKTTIYGSYGMDLKYSNNGTYLNPNHRRTFKMLFRKASSAETPEKPTK